MKKFLLTSLFSAAIILIINSCSKTSEDKLASSLNGSCDTVNMKYNEDVVPILVTNCYRCHGSNSNTGSGGIILEGYDNLLPYVINQKLFGNITHAPGYVPMPFDGGMLSACDINKIRSWLNHGALNN